MTAASTALQKSQLAAADPMVTARGLGMAYGSRRILDDLSFDVVRGEVLAIVGGSGSGKSTLMRLLALLQAPTAGSLTLFGQPATDPDLAEANRLRRRLGVMFQQGALFGDMTVLDNVCVPLREHTRLSNAVIEQIALLKIVLAGLEASAASLYPSQLSGGMRKRASVARAIALDPDILFLDEPSSGLDPISADEMDELVLSMKEALGLTVVLVTHDMNSLSRIADRVLLLADARVAALGTLTELMNSGSAAAEQFFASRRGQAAFADYG